MEKKIESLHCRNNEGIGSTPHQHIQTISTLTITICSLWKVKCSFQGLFYKSIQLHWSVNVWTGDSLNQIIGWHDIPKLLEGKDTPLLASTVTNCNETSLLYRNCIGKVSIYLHLHTA